MMLANSHAAALPWQADPRADGGVRDVAIDRRDIVIARRLAGVRMRIRLATRAYRGVVLAVAETSGGRALFRISLLHADRDFDVVLHEAFDDRDVLAEWRYWGSFFGLPKFIERDHGELTGADQMIGDVALGHAIPLRRRGAAMSKRRGRLRLRRKMGEPARAAAMRDLMTRQTHEPS